MESYNQVFILGSPRSGTTFLASLLTNTRYGAPPETHFITKYLKNINGYGDLSNTANFKKLLKHILSERPVQQWKLDFDLQDFHTEVAPDFSYENIVNCLMRKRNDGQNNSNYWGDKTPSYLSELTLLQSLFPNAKYLYIFRDGRDVALSLLKKPWGPHNIHECANYWDRQNSQQNLLKKLESEGSLLAIKYEELLILPNAVISKIYNFLEEEISDMEIKELETHANKNNSYKWKKTMTARQLRVFEAVAGKTLKNLGYQVQCESAKIPFYELLFYTFHQKLARIIFLLKTNLIDGFKIKYLGKDPFNE